MKLVLLLSLLGVTVVSGIILDGHGGRKHHHHNHHHQKSFETSDSSSSESSERPRHRNRTTVKPTPPCPSDWITFDRPQGRWCVKVFTGNGMDWIAAQTECIRMGASLTGLQDPTERITLATEGRRLLLLNRLGDASIWLGGTRRPECPRVDVCTADKAFQWIDGFTTGNAAMQWVFGYPNGGIWAGTLVQSCIHQFIFPNGDTSTSSTWSGYHHAELDDHWCTSTDGPSYRLYACGRKP